MGSSNSRLKNDLRIKNYLSCDIEHLYSFKSHISISNSSIFFEAIDLYSNLPQAIQEIQKSSQNDESFQQMIFCIQILQDFANPHIVKLYQVIEMKYSYYLVFELLSPKSLMDLILEGNQLSEFRVKELMQDVLYALSVCRANKVIHKDIRPENFLFGHEDEGLKLIDFKLAKQIESEHKSVEFGDIHYRAPETFQGNYDFSSDIWSAGVIFYILLTLKYPFTGKNTKEIVENISKGPNDWDYNQIEVSKSGGDLLKQMLEPNPLFRISADGARQHEWFSERNQTDLAKMESYSKYLSRFEEYNARTISSILIKKLIDLNVIDYSKPPFNINKSELMKAYTLLDSDWSGRVSRSSIYARSSSVLSDIKEAYMENESDSEEELKFHDFLAWNLKLRDCTDEQVTEFIRHYFKKVQKEVFSKNDVENEFQSAEDINDFLHEADADGDGVFSCEEFTKYIKKNS